MRIGIAAVHHFRTFILFSFDRELRSLTFKFLILAEAKIKTAIAYIFSNVHRDPNHYYLQVHFVQSMLLREKTRQSTLMRFLI